MRVLQRKLKRECEIENVVRELITDRECSLKDGGIAQLGEHLLCKQGVNGSIPFISTTGLRKN